MTRTKLKQLVSKCLQESLEDIHIERGRPHTVDYALSSIGETHHDSYYVIADYIVKLEQKISDDNSKIYDLRDRLDQYNDM